MAVKTHKSIGAAARLATDADIGVRKPSAENPAISSEVWVKLVQANDQAAVSAATSLLGRQQPAH